MRKIKQVSKSRKKFKEPTMMGMTMLEVAHDMARGLYEIGAIDAITMREYDMLCLAPMKTFSPKKIKELRLREKVSQPIFAGILNVSASTVKQWEQGTKQPKGASLRLLNLVADKGLSIFINSGSAKATA